ncbi:MAG: phosphate ABC transporter substrate-binding/OmpA family protein [Bacteroidota bacterium]
MIYILFNPEEHTLALQIALRMEEAGVPSYIHSHTNAHSNPEALTRSEAVVLILSPMSLMTYEQHRLIIERAMLSKKTLFPLLFGMSRAEFETKQTPWKHVVGAAATIQIKIDTVGDIIPKIVSALRGIGITPRTSPDTETITSIRSQLHQTPIDERNGQTAGLSPHKQWPRKVVSIAVGIMMVIAFLGAGFFYYQSNAIPEEKIILRIHGSNTIGAKLMPALVEGYIRQLGGSMVQWKAGKNHQEQYAMFALPDSTSRQVIEVFAHGSSYAFKDLGNALCDIGMASREIKHDEAIILQSRGLGNMHSQSNEHVLGLDGLAIIVHPSNPVKSMSVEQVGRIFSGEIVNWKSITGEDATIKLYARDTNSGTHETFQHLVMKVIREDHISGDAHFFEDSDELSRSVAMDPNSIGFLGFVYARDAKVLAISENNSDPLFANFLTIEREDYPLARRLYLYSSATPPNPLVREFIRYALSEEGQRIVHDHKFVDLNVRVENNPKIPATAPKEYLEFIAGAKRIAVNFRFQRSKDLLDTKAQYDLDRVVDYLKEHDYPEMKLAGFADGEGTNDANIRTSVELAEEIAAEFRARGININVNNVNGFGAAVPIASSKSPEGKYRNKRVEVWLQ